MIKSKDLELFCLLIKDEIILITGHSNGFSIVDLVCLTLTRPTFFMYLPDRGGTLEIPLFFRSGATKGIKTKFSKKLMQNGSTVAPLEGDQRIGRSP